MILLDLVARSAARDPAAVAVNLDADGLSYGELDAAANRLARHLAGLGVGLGDRVGIWLDKSPRTVVCMQAVLRLGAAYVPIDPQLPPARAQSILDDCHMRALITTPSRHTSLGAGTEVLTCFVAEGPSWEQLSAVSAAPLPRPAVGPNDLAYILYTSGSTGKPKGVCISQENALAFIAWSVGVLSATAGDCFSNHAPFHFDLSVLDLYVAFWVGARVSIVPEGAAYIPQVLVEFVRQQRPTVWYSVPSALIRMLEAGLAEVTPVPMRAILFAGEPFPIKQLKVLQQSFPGVRLLNLYGPTETNVCTYYEVTEDLAASEQPLPIGKASCGDRVWAVTPAGAEARVGEEGELFVEGPTVMLGYWGKPPHGAKPYATGDLVKQREDGHYLYIGRRDHMVKVRGYRIELGDVEAALLTHPRVHELAVVVVGEGQEARLVAVLVGKVGGAPPTLLEVKAHCASRLPRYMIVDKVVIMEALPRTRNGKVDRLELKRFLAPPTPQP